jgi:hypothetical protein
MPRFGLIICTLHSLLQRSFRLTFEAVRYRYQLNGTIPFQTLHYIALYWYIIAPNMQCSVNLDRSLSVKTVAAVNTDVECNIAASRSAASACVGLYTVACVLPPFD